jgi:hypothetical protein
MFPRWGSSFCKRGSCLNLYHCFRNPFHIDPQQGLLPVLIVEAELRDRSQAGSNGLFMKPNSMTMKRMFTEQGVVTTPRVPFDLNLQEVPHVGMATECESVIRRCYAEDLPRPKRELPSWFVPAVILGQFETSVSHYHLVETGPHGALALKYYDAPAFKSGSDLSFEQLAKSLEKGAKEFIECEPFLTDRCSYWKWRPDHELERKFTFMEIVDIWRLVVILHQSICLGGLPGFVPETDKDFQVFDYHSTIYEVNGPVDEQGYISFIPQADGKTAVKRKWFIENAELRKESLSWGMDIAADDWDEVAASMATAEPVRLTTFRRKRFDVNFESLSTGHVFGIYFDICRDLGGSGEWMSQCEVEYCRTRTLGRLDDVYPEFEAVCGWTEIFLQQQHVMYRRDLYSKLDFARRCYATGRPGRDR